MKRTVDVIAGFCSLLLAVGFGFFLLRYLGEGAGLQFFGWMFSSDSVLIGLVHVVGLILASFLCFVVGITYLARSLVGRAERPKNEE